MLTKHLASELQYVWAIFIQKSSGPLSSQRSWLRNRSRAQAWCKFWRHLSQPILRTRPFLGADFPSQRSHKTMEKHSIWRTSYPPNSHVSHLCCITSARSHPLAHRSSAATLSIVGSWIPKLPLIKLEDPFTDCYWCWHMSPLDQTHCTVLPKRHLSVFQGEGRLQVVPADGSLAVQSLDIWAWTKLEDGPFWEYQN